MSLYRFLGMRKPYITEEDIVAGWDKQHRPNVLGKNDMFLRAYQVRRRTETWVMICLLAGLLGLFFLIFAPFMHGLWGRP